MQKDLISDGKFKFDLHCVPMSITLSTNKIRETKKFSHFTGKFSKIQNSNEEVQIHFSEENKNSLLFIN